ncbi:unnamed protein product [Medioppia subpectinata]|uniref:Uncharacterized protein n=1 Tax=Medioppia subpectinata TaxID=1979941 RepID=A0A7R9QKW5_9ACAR|nr:unnamed protein product [Medioppia subpectinata]CAG2121779.1 unnamed protein product [Medioppia subpectinata]
MNAMTAEEITKETTKGIARRDPIVTRDQSRGQPIEDTTRCRRPLVLTLYPNCWRRRHSLKRRVFRHKTDPSVACLQSLIDREENQKAFIEETSLSLRMKKNVGNSEQIDDSLRR